MNSNTIILSQLNKSTITFGKLVQTTNTFLSEAKLDK